VTKGLNKTGLMQKHHVANTNILAVDFSLSFLYFWSDLVEIKNSNRKYHLVFDGFAKKINILRNILGLNLAQW
jgi:hypothetical protein